MRAQVPRPMMALPVPRIPEGPEWSYEVKWDGYRTIAVKDGSRATLFSRNLKDATRQFPTVARGVAEVRADEAMLDGEVVAIDANGRPSFQALHHHSAHALVFYVFDLLRVNGQDLIRRPLEERRAALAKTVAKTPLLLSETLPGTPAQIEREVRRLQLEGIVAKRRQSVYEPGKRTGAWQKIRFSLRQEFVVGGYKPNESSFDSLLVGHYGDGRLMYAGKVRAGFTPFTRVAVFDRIKPLETRRCPFVNLPTTTTSHWGEGITAEEMELLQWVKPKVVVEVAFTEWTRDANLRHAAFVGLRDDKEPRQVKRET